MDFLAEYASFLAKTVTLVVAILVVLISFAALRSKGRRKSAGQLQVSKLNDFYKGLRERLEPGRARRRGRHPGSTAPARAAGR